MLAAERGHCDMIRLLLNRGADLDARDIPRRGAEAYARYRGRDEAAALLADVRLAGGWDAYVRYPRFKVLALRILCERGRAETDDPLLRRLFPSHAPVEPDGERPPLRARAASGLPKEVFWLVVEFWRSSRDVDALGAPLV